jgi:hypothetical protein
MPDWKCPRCGRRFARARQAHSCAVVPLAAHLAKASPEVRAIYRALMAALRACGPVRAAPTKTGINLLARTSLGSVALQRTSAVLGLVLTRRLRSPRVESYLQLSPRSHHHRIRLAAAREVDAELTGWLREAHAVGMMAGRR